STDRYKQLQVAHQSSLAAGNLARDEADSLRQQLAALQAAEAAKMQQAVDKHRCNQELQSQTAQLLSRLAGLESQLTACRELLRWSGANSDRDWQRVKAELCLLRQASEAAASSDELLRQLADREERLLEMEARLQSLSPPQQLPKKPMESPQQQRRRQQRRHFLSLGGRRRKQTKEDTSGKSDKEDCDVTRADDCGVSSSSSDQTAAILAERVKSTLAMMEARICEAQATARLTGALKVDCDSWKRRCRALEATIASSADWSSPREFMLAPPSLSAGLTASESPMEASTVLKLVQSRDAPDEPTMTSPRASLTSLTATMSRSLAAVDRCRSVSSGDTRGDLRLGHQQQQQQKQQPQKQQALHQKLATAGTARRCLSSLGLNRRRDLRRPSNYWGGLKFSLLAASLPLGLGPSQQSLHFVDQIIGALDLPVRATTAAAGAADSADRHAGRSSGAAAHRELAALLPLIFADLTSLNVEINEFSLLRLLLLLLLRLLLNRSWLAEHSGDRATGCSAVETWRHIDGVGGLPAGHLTHLGVARHDELLPRLMRHRPGICRLRGQPGRVFVGPAGGQPRSVQRVRCGEEIDQGSAGHLQSLLLWVLLLSSCRCCFSCINSLVDSLLRLLRLLPRLLWHLTRPRVKLHTGSHHVPGFAGLLNDEQRRAGSNSGAVLGGDAVAPSLLGAHSLDVEAVNSFLSMFASLTAGSGIPSISHSRITSSPTLQNSSRNRRTNSGGAFTTSATTVGAAHVVAGDNLVEPSVFQTHIGNHEAVLLLEAGDLRISIKVHNILNTVYQRMRFHFPRTYDHVIVRVEAYSILVPGHSRQRLPVHGALQCHLVANVSHQLFADVAGKSRCKRSRRKGKSCLRSTTTRHFVSTRPSRFSATTRYSPSSSGPAESISSECTPVSGSLCSRMPRREYRPSGLLLKYQATSGAGCPEIRQVRRSWEPSATVSSISGLRNVGASPNGLRRRRFPTQRTVASNVCVPLTDSSTGLGLVALSVTVFSSIGGGGGVGGGKGGNGSARAMQLRTPSSRGSSGSMVQVELPPPVLMLMRGGLAARRRSSRNQVTSGVGSPSNSTCSCSRSPSWRCSSGGSVRRNWQRMNSGLKAGLGGRLSAHTPSRFSMSYSKFRRNTWPSLNHWMSGFGEPFTLHCSSSGSSWLTRAGCSSMVKAGGHSTRSRQFVSITPVGSRITQAKVPASSTVMPSQATDVKPSWSSRIHLPPILLVGSGRPLRCHSTSAVPLGIAYSTSREQGEPSVRVKSASSRKNFRSLRTDRVATLSSQSQSKLAGSASSRPRHSGSCVFSSSMKAYSFSMNCSICQAKQIKTAHPEDGVHEHLEELQFLHELLPFGLDWLNVALKVLANLVSSFFEQRLHLGPNFLRLRSFGHNLCLLHRTVLQLSQPVHHAVNFQVQVPQPQQQARFIHSSFLSLASRPAFSAMRATSTESPSRTIFCRSMSTSWNRLRISSLAFWCSLMRYSASGMIDILVESVGSRVPVADFAKNVGQSTPVDVQRAAHLHAGLRRLALVCQHFSQRCDQLHPILPGLQDAQLHLLELFSQPKFDVGEILVDDDEDLLGGQDLLDALALQEDLLVEILGIAKHPLDLFQGVTHHALELELFVVLPDSLSLIKVGWQFALRVQQLGAGPVHPVENATDPVLNLLPGEVRLLQIDAVLFYEDLSLGYSDLETEM
uniref:RUN domain-containing protein n=1 Tax=Macrostomum lignano TaxID=282301 RepID=A0A1I8IP31_9PLAT